ncbi:MAG TPA: cob(I)yrinic acid a,c-diamide adenosyltransferase [Thermoanaerobaculia bacterium]|nr:cob(I)yrinic acid a,c-diamide adenosyltransferase [Thermoanaerobaculia bacterium]
MKIYTRGGDEGETSLLGGERVGKNDPWIEAYGTVDELSAFLGLARASWPDSPLDGELAAIQSDLFDIGAALAARMARTEFPGVRGDRITSLEESIDRMENELAPLRTFILPGGSLAAASLHVARTVCRRAERRVIALQIPRTNPAVAYLNRLSDYLFVAARHANRTASVGDVPWKRS